MRLRHIEVFNAAMVTGSVSGAARLINVTQPAVSRILQRLNNADCVPTMPAGYTQPLDAGMS